MKKINKIEVSLPEIKKKKRVAAYARVSKEADRLKHSLSAQISYYSNLIQNNPDWEFVRIYADAFISGTSTGRRKEFQQMIKDCEDDKIDIIITKSISRFARNTVDLLENVRYLKNLGVEVRFEKENINSMSGDGELMMTILASYAQEEIRSISDNIKWRMRKSMQTGKPNAVTSFQIFGYAWKDDVLVINPTEADIVRRIFREYESGMSFYKIAQGLNNDNIPTKKGRKWKSDRILKILKNITYTGNILFQKEYIADPVSKTRKKNHGELPQYYAENTHEAIIDKSEFDFVQELMKKRGNEKPWMCHEFNLDPFRGKIICGVCGQRYWHESGGQNDKKYHYWKHYNYRNNPSCIHWIINHHSLMKISSEICGFEEFNGALFSEMVEYIYVLENRNLEFHMADGRIIEIKYENTWREDYWTDEKKAELSAERQNISYVKNKSTFTSKIKCSFCGCNFRKVKQVGKQSPTGFYHYWRCGIHGEQCKAMGLRDDILKDIISDLMGTERFDDERFLEQFDHIIVKDETVLELCYKDGRSTEILYEHQAFNPNLRWSKERKKSQSEIIKIKNKERMKNG